MIHYPTIEEVNRASRRQICYWWRFLPSPGSNAIDTPNFFVALDAEAMIMNRIAERFKELGGFSPEISKTIGWKKP
jgi:hypothetical protein